MKRRDILLALPAAALAANAQPKQPKSGDKGKGKKIPSPTEMKKDRHVLAMMLLLMKRKDIKIGTPNYPLIDLVKSTSQDQAKLKYPVLGQIDPGVYTQVQTHLNLVAGNPAAAIKKHQEATKSIAFDAVGDYYPDNECPFAASIDTAVNALIP